MIWGVPLFLETSNSSFVTPTFKAGGCGLRCGRNASSREFQLRDFEGEILPFMQMVEMDFLYKKVQIVDMYTYIYIYVYIYILYIH